MEFLINNEYSYEFENVKRIFIGGGKTFCVYRGGNPYVSVEVNMLNYSECFTDSLIMGDYLLIGNYYGGVFVINLLDFNVVNIKVDGYFGYFVESGECVYMLVNNEEDITRIIHLVSSPNAEMHSHDDRITIENEQQYYIVWDEASLPVIITYGERIRKDWDVKYNENHKGYVTRFEVEDSFGQKYEPHVVGAGYHKELWVPAEELDEFNQHIIGKIENCSLSISKIEDLRSLIDSDKLKMEVIF